MKIISFILKALLLVLVLVAIVFVIVFAVFHNKSTDQYNPQIEDAFTAQTDQKLKLSGPVTLKLFPRPYVIVKGFNVDLSLEDKARFKLKSKELHAQLSWSNFLSGYFDFDFLNFIYPDLEYQKPGQPKFNLKANAFKSRIIIGDDVTTLENLSYITDNTDVTGNLRFEYGQGMDISGHLKGKKFTLDDFVTAKPEAKQTKIVPTTVLALPKLDKLDVSIKLNLGAFHFGKDKLQKLNTELLVSERAAQLKDLKFILAGGQFNGKFKVKESRIGPQIGIELKGRGLEMDKLHSHKEKLSGGKMAIDLNLNARGNSISDWLRQGDGKLLVTANNFVMYNANFKGSISDMAFGFLSFLNPMAKEQQETKVSCVVASGDLKAGVLKFDRGIGIETHQFNVMGDGAIRFPSESIDFKIETAPKSNVSIEIGKFDKLIQLGGTLGEPKIIPRASGIVAQGTSIFAAIATAGASIVVESVMNDLTKDRTPCERILSKAKENKP